MSTITQRRLAGLLDGGAVEGAPDYWYGVVDGFSGGLWSELFTTKADAEKCAKDLEGQVVIVAARILENAEGEQIYGK